MAQILLEQNNGNVKANIFNQYSTGEFKIARMKEVIVHEMKKTHIPVHTENGESTIFGFFVSRLMMYDNTVDEVVDPRTFVIGTIEFA